MLLIGYGAFDISLLFSYLQKNANTNSAKTPVKEKIN
jgi:hypothetical protein